MDEEQWIVVFEVYQHTYLKAVRMNLPQLSIMTEWGGFFVIEQKSTKERHPKVWGSEFVVTESSIEATHWIPYHMVHSVRKATKE